MRTFTWLLVITLGTCTVFAGLVYYSLSRMEPREVPLEAAQGKKIWENHGCIQCHAILGNGGYLASDLTNVINHRDEKWLEHFFLAPPLIPASNKRHKGLEEDQVEKMLEYFRLVAQINTLNWPPPAKNESITLKAKRVR